MKYLPKGGEKMKKKQIIFMLIIMLLILASCSESNEENDRFGGMDSKTFFENITIPEEVSIDINLDDIEYIEEAATYQANYAEFDQQQLIDTLIQHDIVEKNIWAEGPQVIATAPNIQEVLSIYDGGKAFGVETGVEGGFSYWKSKNDIGTDEIQLVASPNFDDTKLAFTLNSDYASYSGLDFLSYDDALVDIKEVLDQVGMPKLEIDETYSLDVETMKSHYELYLNSIFVEEQDKNINWTKDNEAYIFSMQQLVDGIPIVNRGWFRPDGAKDAAFGNGMPATTISLGYDQSGIKYINAYGILEVNDANETNRLITIYEALETLIDVYSLTIIEDDLSINSAKLSYLIIPKDDEFELVPGWMFSSMRSTMMDGNTSNQYKYDVVHAITGELYEGRWK